MVKKVVRTLFDLFKKRIYFPDSLLNIFFIVYVITGALLPGSKPQGPTRLLQGHRGGLAKDTGTRRG